ncbi:MAG TPA: GNAT family N-acetyltransferase [Roseiflexaceae bacterium]|nr:GNAT family N-acetyltransferase [Roseiflexaceae bacterium]
MSDQAVFIPASSYSLEDLGDIFTRSFENYFYPGTTTAAVLAARTRVEQIDLLRSLVLRVGEEPAGIALLALRGDRAWCGGCGVMLPFRGRGLAHSLAAAMLDQARQAGARTCMLEVLTRNQPALRTYLQAGFQPRRDLQIFEWRRPEEWPQPPAEQLDDGLREEARDWLLAHFAALHPAPAAWQRDLPALLTRDGMRGLALGEQGSTRAYGLLTPMPDGGARIEDLAAESAAQATALLKLLQARFSRLVSVNEPADSPLTPAFGAAGFNETDRQHELWVEL